MSSARNTMGSSVQREGEQIRRPQPDGSVAFFGVGLRCRVEVLKPGILLLTISGGASTIEDARVEMAMLAEMDRELELAGKLTVYCDLREGSRMSSQSRDLAAKWMRRHQARLGQSQILVKNKLMEIAMNMIAMLVGGGMLKVYSKEDVFLAVLRKHVPKMTELPRIPLR